MSRRSVKEPRKRQISGGDDALAILLEAHRRRLVAPLFTDRTVFDADAGSGSSDPPETCDIVVALRARTAETAREELAALCSHLSEVGTLVVAATGETGMLDEFLRARFVRVHRFRQRPIAGSIIAQNRFAAARVTPLADGQAAAQSACDIFVCGGDGLDAPPGGLFETETQCVITLLSDLPPQSATLPMRFAAGDIPVVPRTEAVALVHRLMSREAALTDLAMQLRVIQTTPLIPAANAASGWADIVRATYPWPLRDNPTADRTALDWFEHRPDDDVFDCAQAGDAFLRQWAIGSDTPDFAGAVATLNAAPHDLSVVEARDTGVPDVSIVIPVYGQLGYTLNCLDALFAHRSARTAEIIVVDDDSPDESRLYLPQIAGIRFLPRVQNGGFIASCNEGASLARGRIIVMLNNDTRVMPGWLDALVDSFDMFPRAGLVGSKLLYPDGTLQECGGIVWRDASAWNFGRDDDPNRPEYTHARQVDYVSGASIAIPTAIWNTIGGFDPFYAPAYYEDVDLTFRLREAGYETWVQPQSRLIHYEGRTSGTDVRIGVKSYQTRNRGRFFLRHREALQHMPISGTSPLLTRENRVRRRALVIEPTTPTLKEDAGSAYTVMILQFLQDLGYKPYFVPENLLYRPEHTPLLHRFGVECAYVPYDTSMQSFLQRHGPLIDVVVVFRALTFERTIDLLRTFVPQAPIVYNNVDLHYLRLQRAAELAGDQDALAEALAFKRRELAVTALADCVLSPSPFEVELLARELPGVPALALPLMSDIENTRRGFETRRDICFLGGYGHAPNVDAVRYFIDEVLPLIHRDEPGLRFIVAGANPTDEVRALARDHVIVTGLIDDLRDLFDEVRVFVCPLRFGAGMKGKIITAMSYGVPVISTSVGVEGIAVEDGMDVIVADSPEDIAAGCLRVYRNPVLWSSLSGAGLELVANNYSRATGREVLRRALDVAFERRFSENPPP